jgi:penicillin-binding protein 2
VPEPGHTVQLTIDSEFQKAVDQALAKNVEWIRNSYGDSKQASAGAVVVIDVKTGGVLAASNYPSFDQNLYAANYSAYSEDENMPLFNRALQGLYTPGSTYKPSVAVAALDTGLINRHSTVLCNGVYTYYKDYHPKCTRHGHSGNIDVVTAIKWSCNIFFYDVGRRLTSDVYDAYAYKLGLGQRTGVEVSEALGRLTTKNDSNYTESLDVQAAIGQGNTAVTPIQLATYAATLANRGTAPTSSRPSSTPTPERRWKRPSRRLWMSSKTRARPLTWSGKGCWGWPRPSRRWPATPTPSPARPAAPSAARVTMRAAPISTTPMPP